MRRIAFNTFILLVCVSLLAVCASPVQAAASTAPQDLAEQMRAALFAAQRDLLAGGDGLAAFAQAQAAYGSLRPLLAGPAADAAVSADQAFSAMEDALAGADAPAFATQRSLAWTAVLAGSYRMVEQAMRAGEHGQAQAWLALREYRTVNRFARPNADATLAVQRLAASEMDAETALQFLRADLFDAYQARLGEALRELQLAEASGFAVRRAELAGLAQGYFGLLSVAYLEQRGAAALQTAQQAFQQLTVAALAGQPLAARLEAVTAVLKGFRAAPLSPAEQSRRAGQLLRYVNLVSVEYGRGVSDGRVTLQFEIQEAVTFQEAAQAAFDDLRDLLAELDAPATQQAQTHLSELNAMLRSANSGGAVASAADMRTSAEQLLALLNEVIPAEWKQGSTSGDFDVIDSMLDQMENAVRGGDYAAAESARIEAYAIMESGPEARLIAMAPDLKLRVEELFWNGNSQTVGLSRLLSEQAPLQELRSVRVALDAQLAEVETLLSGSSTPASILSNAAVIVFREGLEAVLILASLMGSFKAAEGRKYRQPLWLGSGLALLATVLTWTLAREVLQALARYGEKLEAVISLIAIIVLLLITNWFFHKSYWDGWLARFHARKRSLLSGETGLLLGLVSLGFTSVYREGFETVLFLQALVLDGGTSVVLGGVAIGLAFTLLVGLLTFRFQARLPHKKMLIVTGIMIGAVLLVMVGKTVYVFQLVGWMPATLVSGLSFPTWFSMWFGVYPSWEGLLLQFSAAAFVIGSYYLAEGLRKRQRA